MINRSFRLVVVALCTIYGQWACKPAPDTVKPIEDNLTINEARAWLTTYKKSLRAGEKEVLSIEAYWHLAQVQTFTNGQAVVVLPLTYGFEPATVFRGQAPQGAQLADVATHAMQSKLLIFKDANGILTAERIEIIPTEAYRAANPRIQASSFTGHVIRYAHLSNTRLTCWTYRNGQLVDKLDYSLLKGGRQTDMCTYFVSRKLGGAPPARLGGGGDGGSGGSAAESGSSSVIINFGGEYYELTSYTAPCPDGGSTNGGGDSFGSFGGGSGGTGDGGSGYGSSSGGGGYTLGTTIYNEDGTVSPSAADNFINLMRYTNSPSIIFTPEECSLIREYPELIASINDHINQYGVKPDGSRAFKLSAEIQQNYPRFANLVRGLPDFVENDPKVKAALIEFSGISWSEIKPKLKYGSGPELFVTDLLQQEGAKLVGNCTCNGPGTPNRIDIEVRYVRGLEQATLTGTQQATAFLLGVTILHEFVHHTRSVNNLPEGQYEY